MKQIFLAALAMALVGLPAWAALDVGRAAPDFSAQAAQGGKTFPFTLSEALRKGPVVLYFFPAAFTSGCTIEAHEFADAAAAEAAGLRACKRCGNIDRLAEFSVSECRSKFPVAADPNAAIAKTYDATLAVFPGHSNRTSYVIAPDDNVIFVYSDLKPDEHVARTLAALKAWRALHHIQ